MSTTTVITCVGIAILIIWFWSTRTQSGTSAYNWGKGVLNWDPSELRSA